MRSQTAAFVTTLLVVLSPGASLAQPPPQSAPSVAVPRLINISGVFTPDDKSSRIIGSGTTL